MRTEASTAMYVDKKMTVEEKEKQCASRALDFLHTVQRLVVEDMPDMKKHPKAMAILKQAMGEMQKGMGGMGKMTGNGKSNRTDQDKDEVPSLVMAPGVMGKKRR